jgi:hypothetical protein
MTLLNAHRWMLQVQSNLCWVGLGQVCDAHEQRIISNGVINIPPHDFKQPSRWYYRLFFVTKYTFGAIIHGMKSIPNLVKILTEIIKL